MEEEQESVFLSFFSFPFDPFNQSTFFQDGCLLTTDLYHDYQNHRIGRRNPTPVAQRHPFVPVPAFQTPPLTLPTSN
jgi:hypothetical protein